MRGQLRAQLAVRRSYQMLCMARLSKGPQTLSLPGDPPGTLEQRQAVSAGVCLCCQRAVSVKI